MHPDITVLIPTQDRHAKLSRILKYLDGSGLKIKVFDSTADSFEKLNDFPGIEYEHLPGKELFIKNHDAVQSVKTKFTVFCADDDFIIPDGVKHCTEFLEENHDYSCAQGNYISHRLVNRSVVYKPIYLNFIDANINMTSAADRLVSYFSNYIQLFYAVHRADSIKRVFSEGINKIKNYNLMELLVAGLSIINGKYKTIPVFYSSRESGTPSSSNETDSLEEISTSEKYKSEYASFLNSFAINLAEVDKVEPQVAAGIIQKALQIYVERTMQRNTLTSGKSGDNANLRTAVKKIPYLGKQVLSKYDNTLGIKNLQKEGEQQVEGLEGFPFDKTRNQAALNKIKELIKEIPIRE
ncbi:MAG: TIGR00180 family glycosyltransferase [Bacteroidetes bacterium]|nr:TIGR00180 family glycosyltransferase [Bacteroidota bacterium]